MNKITTFLRSKKKHKTLIIILSLFVIAIAVRIVVSTSSSRNNEDNILTTSDPQVELFEIVGNSSSPLELSCRIEASQDVELKAQASGEITRIQVQDGETVRKGDVLLRIENTQQRLAVSQAREDLATAELALSDLVRDNSGENSLVQQTQRQQQALVSNARSTFLNNDLQAYPQDNQRTGAGEAPIISGNYSCEEEGEYRIELYSSSTTSGYSYQFSGIESGKDSVITSGFGTPLGNCGLFISFADGFSPSTDWVIPVPNTRSATYQNTLASYNAALESRDVTLNQTKASPEQIQQAQSRVEQARLRYQSAQDSLSKTVVRSPINGSVSGFSFDQGDFLSTGTIIGSVKSAQDLEAVAYITPSQRSTISDENSVFVNEEQSAFRILGNLPDSETRKIKVAMAIPEALQATVGESDQVQCVVDRSSEDSEETQGVDEAIIPLAAVSIIGTDSYVFTVDEDQSAQKVSVTVETLLGDFAKVSGVEGVEFIIDDARGINEGIQLDVVASQ